MQALYGGWKYRSLIQQIDKIRLHLRSKLKQVEDKTITQNKRDASSGGLLWKKMKEERTDIKENKI